MQLEGVSKSLCKKCVYKRNCSIRKNHLKNNQLVKECHLAWDGSNDPFKNLGRDSSIVLKDINI